MFKRFRSNPSVISRILILTKIGDRFSVHEFLYVGKKRVYIGYPPRWLRWKTNQAIEICRVSHISSQFITLNFIILPFGACFGQQSGSLTPLLIRKGGGGSRITIDRFPNSCSPRKCLYFISLKSPSWAFSGSFRQGYWPDFNLGNLYSKSCRKIFIYEKLTDSRKTVETGVDLRLLILSSFPIHCNRSLMARSELNRDKFNDRKISKTTVQDTLETTNRARLCPENYWVV